MAIPLNAEQIKELRDTFGIAEGTVDPTQALAKEAGMTIGEDDA